MDLPQNAARDFRRTLSRPAFVPIFGLAGLGVGFLLLIGMLVWAGFRARHGRQIIAQGSEVQTIMVDLETGLRGYALRRDREFLEPYLLGLPMLDVELAEFQRLVEGNPAQLQRVDDVIDKSQQWRRYAADNLEALKAHAGITLKDAVEAKQLMDEIRGDVKAIVEVEAQQIGDRDRIVFLTVLVCVIASVLLTGLFGYFLVRRLRKTLRDTAATYTQVIRTNRKQERELAMAFEQLDKELKAVARIQRSLLPKDVPSILGMELATHYAPSSRAGGDYYDFFPLHHHGEPGTGNERHPERWGMLIADVSGHGTPAAVMMAVTHSIAHSYDEPPAPPSDLLEFVNRRLCRGYTSGDGVSFVTAFYAIYCPATRRFEYASAGHNPPRVRRAATGQIQELRGAGGLPLGIMDSAQYDNATLTLEPGDLLVLYTDGITESRNNDAGFFETDGLDAVLRDASGTPQDLVDRTIAAVRTHADGRDPDDDQTLIVGRVYASD